MTNAKIKISFTISDNCGLTTSEIEAHISTYLMATDIIHIERLGLYHVAHITAEATRTSDLVAELVRDGWVDDMDVT